MSHRPKAEKYLGLNHRVTYIPEPPLQDKPFQINLLAKYRSS